MIGPISYYPKLDTFTPGTPDVSEESQPLKTTTLGTEEKRQLQDILSVVDTTGAKKVIIEVDQTILSESYLRTLQLLPAKNLPPMRGSQILVTLISEESGETTVSYKQGCQIHVVKAKTWYKWPRLPIAYDFTEDQLLSKPEAVQEAALDRAHGVWSPTHDEWEDPLLRAWAEAQGLRTKRPMPEQLPLWSIGFELMDKFCKKLDLTDVERICLIHHLNLSLDEKKKHLSRIDHPLARSPSMENFLQNALLWCVTMGSGHISISDTHLEIWLTNFCKVTLSQELTPQGPLQPLSSPLKWIVCNNKPLIAQILRKGNSNPHILLLELILHPRPLTNAEVVLIAFHIPHCPHFRAAVFHDLQNHDLARIAKKIERGESLIQALWHSNNETLQQACLNFWLKEGTSFDDGCFLLEKVPLATGLKILQKLSTLPGHPSLDRLFQEWREKLEKTEYFDLDVFFEIAKREDSLSAQNLFWLLGLLNGAKKEEILKKLKPLNRVGWEIRQKNYDEARRQFLAILASVRDPQKITSAFEAVLKELGAKQGLLIVRESPEPFRRPFSQAVLEEATRTKTLLLRDEVLQLAKGLLPLKDARREVLALAPFWYFLSAMKDQLKEPLLGALEENPTVLLPAVLKLYGPEFIKEGRRNTLFDRVDLASKETLFREYKNIISLSVQKKYLNQLYEQGEFVLLKKWVDDKTVTLSDAEIEQFCEAFIRTIPTSECYKFLIASKKEHFLPLLFERMCAENDPNLAACLIKADDRTKMYRPFAIKALETSKSSLEWIELLSRYEIDDEEKWKEGLKNLKTTDAWETLTRFMSSQKAPRDGYFELQSTLLQEMLNPYNPYIETIFLSPFNLGSKALNTQARLTFAKTIISNLKREEAPKKVRLLMELAEVPFNGDTRNDYIFRLVSYMTVTNHAACALKGLSLIKSLITQEPAACFTYLCTAIECLRGHDESVLPPVLEFFKKGRDETSWGQPLLWSAIQMIHPSWKWGCLVGGEFILSWLHKKLDLKPNDVEGIASVGMVLSLIDDKDIQAIGKAILSSPEILEKRDREKYNRTWASCLLAAIESKTATAEEIISFTECHFHHLLFPASKTQIFIKLVSKICEHYAKKESLENLKEHLSHLKGIALSTPVQAENISSFVAALVRVGAECPHTMDELEHALFQQAFELVRNFMETGPSQVMIDTFFNEIVFVLPQREFIPCLAELGRVIACGKRPSLLSSYFMYLGSQVPEYMQSQHVLALTQLEPIYYSNNYLQNMVLVFKKNAHLIPDKDYYKCFSTLLHRFNVLNKKHHLMMSSLTCLVHLACEESSESKIDDPNLSTVKHAAIIQFQTDLRDFLKRVQTKNNELKDVPRLIMLLQGKGITYPVPNIRARK